MDSQGFAPSGLAPRPAKAATTKVPTRARAPKPTAEDRAIGTLQTVQGTTSMLWLWQGLAWISAGPAWVFGKLGWKRGEFALRNWLQAPVNAMMNTPTSEAWKVQANMVDEASMLARQRGDQVRAVAMEARREGWMAYGGKLRERFMNFINPARQAVGARLDAAKPDGWLSRNLRSFTQWRVNRNAPKVDKAVAEVHELVSGIVKATDLPKDSVALQSAFSPVLKLLERAKTLQGEQRSAVLQEAHAMATRIAKQSGLSGAAVTKAGEMITAISAASQSASALVKHQAALAAGGARALAKNAMAIGGRVPLFYTIAGLGVLAGVTASMLVARRDNRQAKQSIAEMKNDLGDAHHPIVQQLEKAEQSQRGKRWLSAGLNGANEAVYLTPPTSGMGMALMVGANSALPALSQMLAPQSQTLSAYQTLKKADQGLVKLTVEQKAELIGHIVAAVPSVSSQGGLNNRLVQPISNELAKRNLNAHELLHLVAHPTQFTALANEVAATVKTNKEVAAAKAAEEKPDLGAAPMIKADAPSLTIAAAKGTSQGKLVEAQRAQGQV